MQKLEDEYCGKHNPEHIKKIQKNGSHHLEKLTHDYFVSRDVPK
jgi:hypothetical protein